MSADPVILAAAPYEVGQVVRWEDFAHRIEQYASQAVAAGASLLLFPEYSALDLAGALGDPARGDLAATCAGMQDWMNDYRSLHRALAQLHRMWVIAGSIPVAVAGGRYANRAWVYAPDGAEGFQDKILLTPFERAGGLLVGGTELRVFEAAFGRFGVNICYDSEFPLLARLQAEAGARLLLAPSDTETPHGHHRVRIGCQARALENQIAVLQCPLLGAAAWSPAVDVNVGRAALYAPPDTGLPEEGVVAQGEWNDPRLFTARAPLARIGSVRRHGQVSNFNDWPGQRDLRVVLPGD